MPYPIAQLQGHTDGEQEIDVVSSVDRPAGIGFVDVATGEFVIPTRDIVANVRASAMLGGYFRCRKQNVADVLAIGDNLEFAANGVVSGEDPLCVRELDGDSHVIAELNPESTAATVGLTQNQVDARTQFSQTIRSAADNNTPPTDTDWKGGSVQQNATLLVLRSSGERVELWTRGALANAWTQTQVFSANTLHLVTSDVSGVDAPDGKFVAINTSTGAEYYRGAGGSWVRRTAESNASRRDKQITAIGTIPSATEHPAPLIGHKHTVFYTDGATTQFADIEYFEYRNPGVWVSAGTFATGSASIRFSTAANVAALAASGTHDPAQSGFTSKYPPGANVVIATNGVRYEQQGGSWVPRLDLPVIVTNVAARDALSERLDGQVVSVRNRSVAPFVLQDFIWDTAGDDWILFRDLPQPISNLTAEGTVNTATASKLTFASTSTGATQVTYRITVLDQAQDGTTDFGSNDPRVITLTGAPGAVSGVVAITDTASVVTSAMLSGTMDALTLNAYATGPSDVNHADLYGDLLMEIETSDGANTKTSNLTVI